MMNIDKIDKSTTLLYQWLDSWCQESGAYNGFVVHRLDLKRLKEIHETPWGHCAVIEGMITLYEKKPRLDLKEKIEKAVQLQISRLDTDGSFINAGFEDDRFSSLVHNSMADRALLKYCKYAGAEILTKERALKTVKRNIEEYLIGKLWNSDVGAFKFSKVDYYSLDIERYVANMNCVAIEALLLLYHLTEEKLYLDYAVRCGEWVKKQQLISDNIYINGGISYGSTNPQNIVGIYTGLCIPGLCALYKETHDLQLKKIAIAAVQNLVNYTDNGFFCHSIDGERELRYPYFIAGAGIILYGIDEANVCFDLEFDLDVYLNKLFKYQFSNGAFENFKHYNCRDNNRPTDHLNYVVWEDVVPCLPWNAQLFRFLARKSSGLGGITNYQKVVSVHLNFLYFEGIKYMFVISIAPLRSFTVLFINKQKDISIVALSLKHFVNRIKRFWSEKK